MPLWFLFVWELGKFYMVSLALSCPQHPQNYCGGFGILQGKESFMVVGRLTDVFLVVLVMPLVPSELLWWLCYSAWEKVDGRMLCCASESQCSYIIIVCTLFVLGWVLYSGLSGPLFPGVVCLQSIASWGLYVYCWPFCQQ